jgi:hypothetical protein
MRSRWGIAAGLGLSWLAFQPGASAWGPVPSTAAAAEQLAGGADPVASYELYASLDTAKHTVQGKGTIVFVNASSVPQREIWIHLYLNAFKSPRTVFMRFPEAGSFRGAGVPSEWGSITVERLAIHDGPDLWPGADKTSPGDPEDETDVRVPLPSPLAPGATLTLDVAFQSRLPNVLFRTGHHRGFYMVAQWFPKLARLEPDGRWAHFTFHHLSEFYADFGRYDVTVETPGDMIVGATGQLASEARLGDRIARRFVQADVHDFAFAAYRDFQELTATEGGVAIRLLYPPGHRSAAEVEMESVRFGLKHLGEAYGRYPYPTLTVVHPPAGAEEAGGMEYPTLITTGGPWYLPWTGLHFLEGVTIHELGHQWFYGLVATDEHTWPFLDEGINSYAEAEAMEALFPHRSGFGGLGLSVSIPAYMRTTASDAERNAPVAQPAPDFANGRDYGALVYQRTATILTTLANVYGKDAVRRAIGLYARRERFRHPGPEALLSAIGEVAGADAEAQLRAALFGRATVDYVVESIESSPDEPPEKGWHGSALVRRRGDLRFPVDVDLVGADGSVQRVRWDAAESAARLPYRGKTMLAAAVVDPEHLVLLDDDLGNNARALSPSRVSGRLLDRFAFAAEALLSGLLP